MEVSNIVEEMYRLHPTNFFVSFALLSSNKGNGNNVSKKSHAFHFRLKKSKEGDQELMLKMVACKIVASPMLLLAVKDFFKLPEKQVEERSSSSRANPFLYRSVSGEHDLFFDAKETGMSTILTPTAGGTATKSQFDFSTPSSKPAQSVYKDSNVSDKLSSAIVDAWNGKNKQKQTWKMDLDISAPILVLPACCTDPNATALVCNFGRFNFAYGVETSSPAIVGWFEAHRRHMEPEIDHLRLKMNDLSFTVGSVGEASGNDHSALVSSVIEPVSFTLDIGLEHTLSASDGKDPPRTCIVGVLPGIVLRLAPAHVTKILRVVAIWTSNLHTLRGDALVEKEESPVMLPGVEEEESQNFDLEIVSSGSASMDQGNDLETQLASGGRESLLSKKDRLESMLLSRQSSDSSNATEFMHVSVSLLRLSINVYTDRGDGLEAHLVSVVASSSLITDGTSSTNLSMGW